MEPVVACAHAWMLPASTISGSKPTIACLIAIGHSIVNMQRESSFTTHQALRAMRRRDSLANLGGKDGFIVGTQSVANAGMQGNRLPRMSGPYLFPPSAEPSFPHQVFIGRIRAALSLHRMTNLFHLDWKSGNIACSELVIPWVRREVALNSLTASLIDLRCFPWKARWRQADMQGRLQRLRQRKTRCTSSMPSWIPRENHGCPPRWRHLQLT